MRRLAFGIVLGLVVAGCGGSSIARAELAPIVVRDGLPFDLEAVPAAVVDRLAGQRVVVVGETHLIREQRQFTAALVRAHHAERYRQLLPEWPHLADWVMSEYAVDGDRRPEWWLRPTYLCGDLITAIRDSNRTLPAKLAASTSHCQAIGGPTTTIGLLHAMSGIWDPRWQNPPNRTLRSNSSGART